MTDLVATIGQAALPLAGCSVPLLGCPVTQLRRPQQVMRAPIVLVSGIPPAINVAPTFVTSLIPFRSRAIPHPSGLIAA
ncbi:hypothetical protein ITP53_48265 [Nonomuraea sp. K274]|uniref:Uncharacterized protein n=1 Tax=Nonomuraea cypriaca TaxID=1187855 RepID=A0A931F6P0_9ACTN|nr:hypothetical protein [Nonomuraea cypriaca]MBF8193341.1 hypothetical protein [Nonomuraea cypriaca]